MKISVALLLLLASTAPTAPAAEPEELELTDRVTTVPLTEPLPSWGALGGVSVDRLGFVYVANFRDSVWRISPDGYTRLLSDALYGSSGNAVDSRGNLLQANFHNNTISRINRSGEVATFVSDGLSGPVGIAVDADDTLYVCNCSGNTISKVDSAGRAETFAESTDFACPNGITFDNRGQLYVVNFANPHVVRVTKEGVVSRFASIGTTGNAHLAFARGSLYVTKMLANRVYKVGPDGAAVLLGGTGELGVADGPAAEATFSRPNGIAVDTTGTVLYVNDLIGPWQGNRSTRISLRRIELFTLADAFGAALERDGLDAARAAYRRYKSDPKRQQDDTRGEAVRLAFRLMSNREVREGLALMALNAESYPEDATSQFQLGEAYRMAGQNAAAIEAYERVLQLESSHDGALARLASMRGPD